MANGFIIIFSHILPLIIGFFSILLIINGIMDEEKHISIIGEAYFYYRNCSVFTSFYRSIFNLTFICIR